MVDSDPKCPNETPAPELPYGLTLRELALLRHYTDPASPGYQNATRAAELAGYGSPPGSNALSVQGSRTLKKARELGVLSQILNKKNCTLERAAERLSASLDAKRRSIFVSNDGQVVECPPEDDYHQQLRAAKLVSQLHGVLGNISSQELPPVSSHEKEHVTDQEQVTREYRNAIGILSNSDAVDRESLRDVLDCDKKSAEFQPQEPQCGAAEQPEERPVVEDDSSKA